MYVLLWFSSHCWSASLASVQTLESTACHVHPPHSPLHQFSSPPGLSLQQFSSPSDPCHQKTALTWTPLCAPSQAPFTPHYFHDSPRLCPTQPAPDGHIGHPALQGFLWDQSGLPVLQALPEPRSPRPQHHHSAPTLDPITTSEVPFAFVSPLH